MAHRDDPQHSEDLSQGFPARAFDDQALNADDLEQAYLHALEKLEASDAHPPWESDANLDPLRDYGSLPFDPPDSGIELQDESPLETETLSGDLGIVPGQIIEAILFVGGPPLTAKKIASLFDADVDHFLIEDRIEGLNLDYLAQNRPYEIRLGEGGYRLALKPEFESIRNRVYGIGPREVRLSQDCLEVLALIAYSQPLSHQRLLESGKKNASNLVRQLIRRELVIIERMENSAKAVTYRTTTRFLSLFGLASLEELPLPDGLNLR